MDCASVDVYCEDRVSHVSYSDNACRLDLHGIKFRIPPAFCQTGHLILIELDLLTWFAVLENVETWVDNV